MRPPRLIWVGVALVLAVMLATSATRILERLVNPRPASVAADQPADADRPHITVTLYFVSTDGQSLATVRREVPLADDVVSQGREILLAQLGAPSRPYLPAVPLGTTLRALYVTERGEAFVDLSREASSAHPGGTLAELLTVHAIVNAITANLPTVHRVQILLEGKEVDSLAGHVDLREPLARDTSLVR